MAVTHDWVPEETFGTRLQRARKFARLSQSEAAARCEIDVETWGKWERGIHIPHDMADVAKKINAGLGVNPIWLVLGEFRTTGTEDTRMGVPAEGNSHAVRTAA